MQLTDHFTLEEMIVSEVAARHGLSNIPATAQINNLYRVAQFLEQVRAKARAQYGQDKAIFVTSGYRSPQVNALVGGAATSAHCDGRAADIHCPGVPVLSLAKLIEASITGYDQLIHEYGSWVHVGLSSVGTAPRHQSLTIAAPPFGTKPGLLPL